MHSNLCCSMDTASPYHSVLVAAAAAAAAAEFAARVAGLGGEA